jgi:hypothetical protein
MKLPKVLVDLLIIHVFRRINIWHPDRLIGSDDDTYMERWFVIPKNRFFNIYLHRFLRSDDDRALHDHPWWNISILLLGKYTEHTIDAGGIHHREERVAGAVKCRGAKSAHRIELTDGYCWSLFITGPVVREWGFHCPTGWRPSKGFSQHGCD